MSHLILVNFEVVKLFSSASSRRSTARKTPTLPGRLPDNTNFSNPVIPLGARESGSKLGYSATAVQGQAALARGLFRRLKNEQSFAVGREEKRGTVPF